MAGRKILKSGGLVALAAMLATSVAPAIATAQENGGALRGMVNRSAEAQRGNAGGGEQRSAPAWRGRGGGGGGDAPRAQQAAPVARQQGGGEGRWQRRVDGNQQPRATWQGGERRGDRDGRWDGRRNDGVQSGGPLRGMVENAQRREGDRQWRDGNRRDDGRRWDRGDHRRWSNDWRRDRRYDWSGYRNSNRNVYRLGRYYAPYRNYYYRPLGIGFYLDTLFFGSRYWINDPWQYRLPPAYGPYRWVRYYDDVLLVDIYTGEVVDVIRNFFW